MVSTRGQSQSTPGQNNTVSGKQSDALYVNGSEAEAKGIPGKELLSKTAFLVAEKVRLKYRYKIS